MLLFSVLGESVLYVCFVIGMNDRVGVRMIAFVHAVHKEKKKNLFFLVPSVFVCVNKEIRFGKCV